MRIKVFLYGVAGLLLAWSGPALGQHTAADSSFLSLALSQMSAQYTTALTYESPLYNGAEYVTYRKPYASRIGHPFFTSPDEQKGTIFYDGFRFTDVPMRYDMTLDLLVLTHPENPLQLRLVGERVQYFTVHGHTFIRVTADSASQATITTGFYDLLFDHGIQALARRTKRLQERTVQTGTEAEFTAVDKLYIQKEGRYFPISSKGSVLDLFPAHKKQLQAYARTQQLSFGKARREASIVQLLQYYVTLAPASQPAP